MTWWNQYVGIPYEWCAGSREAASCWGLVCLVQREVFGKKLPAFDEMESAVQGGSDGDPGRYAALGQRIPIEQARSGDVLHMRGFVGGRVAPLHCGVVTVPGEVLHTEEGPGSHVQKYIGNPRFMNRVLGAYRVV